MDKQSTTDMSLRGDFGWLHASAATAAATLPNRAGVQKVERREMLVKSQSKAKALQDRTGSSDRAVCSVVVVVVGRR